MKLWFVIDLSLRLVLLRTIARRLLIAVSSLGLWLLIAVSYLRLLITVSGLRITLLGHYRVLRSRNLILIFLLSLMILFLPLRRLTR